MEEGRDIKRILRLKLRILKRKEIGNVGVDEVWRRDKKVNEREVVEDVR